MWTQPACTWSPSSACFTDNEVRRLRMSASRLRCRGSRCWTTTMPAGNSARSLENRTPSAFRPPAEAATATMSNPLGGSARSFTPASMAARVHPVGHDLRGRKGRLNEHLPDERGAVRQVCRLISEPLRQTALRRPRLHAGGELFQHDGALLERPDGRPDRVLYALRLRERERLWRVGVTDPAAKADQIPVPELEQRAPAVGTGEPGGTLALGALPTRRTRRFGDLGRHPWLHPLSSLHQLDDGRPHLCE